MRKSNGDKIEAFAIILEQHQTITMESSKDSFI